MSEVSKRIVSPLDCPVASIFAFALKSTGVVAASTGITIDSTEAKVELVNWIS